MITLITRITTYNSYTNCKLEMLTRKYFGKALLSILYCFEDQHLTIFVLSIDLRKVMEIGKEFLEKLIESLCMTSYILKNTF